MSAILPQTDNKIWRRQMGIEPLGHMTNDQSTNLIPASLFVLLLMDAKLTNMFIRLPNSYAASHQWSALAYTQSGPDYRRKRHGIAAAKLSLGNFLKNFRIIPLKF